jgi:hypothetical protein
MPHIIRLREPWNVSGDADRRVELRRRFNCPTGLRPEDRVELVVEGLATAPTILLNGQLLPMTSDTANTLRCEIQSHLIAHNEVVLRLLVGLENTTDSLLAQLRTDVLAAGLVRLEIRDKAGSNDE